MDTKAILEYLSGLQEHNNREWYRDNREAYLYAHGEFIKLIHELVYEIGRKDPSVLGKDPEKLTFKLTRDTRFSRDKSPYNPAFRAHIGPGGKLPVPVGYYLVLRPGGGSFLGGGLFADMFKDATERIRRAISSQGGQWEQIIGDPVFAEHFKVMGSSLKRIPQGWDAGHPQAQYLKYKSWYLEYPIPDQLILDSEEFIRTAVRIYGLMMPFNAYLNRALEGFSMPERT